MALGGVAAGTPNQTQAATKRSVTVTAQTDLNQALKNSKVAKITVKTKKAVSLTVKKGDYQDKTLVLSGEKITLKNAGSFQKISIQDAKQFTEKAENNTISVTDPNTLKLTAAAKRKKRQTNCTPSVLDYDDAEEQSVILIVLIERFCKGRFLDTRCW